MTNTAVMSGGRVFLPSFSGPSSSLSSGESVAAAVKPSYRSAPAGELGAGRRARHRSNMLEFQMDCVRVDGGGRTV